MRLRSADLISAAAEVLGRREEAVEFRAMATGLRRAFHHVYVSADRILSDCTTVYSLAIVFGLLDDRELVWAGDRLADLVSQSGHHISTGFAGTPFIADALSSTGHVDTAYRLLLQRECPSWLYPVTMGATTIWERWDSMLPDGRINPGDMTSFNHYALGAVADWMHRVIGGIAPLDAGYCSILVAPQIGRDIDWARTSLDTPHGRVAVEWTRQTDVVSMTVSVPPGTTAIVRWPATPDRMLPPGEHVVRLPAVTVERVIA